MQKPTFKNKSFTRNRAFTLIELLIVIAIIGILFIVLVSKVDFATDKAKATGVQTDFRSFQLAFETVAKENAGFNTFGWDTGDTNANGKRDSYDEGDDNKDGIQNNGEVWTGHKTYAETWTRIYSLRMPGKDPASTNYHPDAIAALEAAINANLDPKLHITISDNGTISMANGAQDPWNKEYHGYYITNADVDKKDRGAIVMYSDGANNEFGSAHSIANGVVSITVPGNNKFGKDDYAMSVVYTYTNGYGETQTITSGFSNNQEMLGGTNVTPNTPDVEPDDNITNTDNPYIPGSDNSVENLSGGLYKTGTNYTEAVYTWQELIDEGIISYDTDWNRFKVLNKDALVGDLKLPDDVYSRLEDSAFKDCTGLTGLVLPKSITYIDNYALSGCISLTDLSMYHVTHSQAIANLPALENIWYNDTLDDWFNTHYHNENLASFADKIYIQGKLLEEVTFTQQMLNKQYAMTGYIGLKKAILPENITNIYVYYFSKCTGLTEITINGFNDADTFDCFADCKGLKTVYLNGIIDDFGNGSMFSGCTNLETIYVGKDVTDIGTYWDFLGCENLKYVYYEGTIDDWCKVQASPWYSNNAYLMIDNQPVTDVVLSNVTEIKYGLFYKYDHLLSFNSGPNMTKIGEKAFSNCKNLKTVVLSDSITHIGNDAFDWCMGITTFNVPKNLEVVGNNAFYEIRNANVELVLEKIQSIGYLSFYNMRSEIIVLSDDLTSIGQSAFANSNAKVITIGSGIQNIGQHAFIDALYVTDIYINAETPPVINESFRGCKNLQRIHVSAGCLEAYQNEPSWAAYVNLLVEQ